MQQQKGLVEISEELWDEFSELMGTDIDDAMFFTGKELLTEPKYKKLIEKLGSSIAAPLLQEAAEWVSDAVEFAEFCADNFRRLATQWYPHYTTKYGAGNLTTAELYQLFIQQTRPAQTKQ